MCWFVAGMCFLWLGFYMVFWLESLGPLMSIFLVWSDFLLVFKELGLLLLWKIPLYAAAAILICFGGPHCHVILACCPWCALPFIIHPFGFGLLESRGFVFLLWWWYVKSLEYMSFSPLSSVVRLSSVLFSFCCLDLVLVVIFLVSLALF